MLTQIWWRMTAKLSPLIDNNSDSMSDMAGLWSSFNCFFVFIIVFVFISYLINFIIHHIASIFLQNALETLD